MEKTFNMIYWIAAGIAICFGASFLYCRYGGKRRQKKDDVPSLIPIIGYFKGQCNSFRIVAEKPDRIQKCEKVFEYADKVFEFHADDVLKNWWKNFSDDRNQWNVTIYSKKAEQLLYLLRSSGVVPSTEKQIVWDADASERYIPYDDVEDGDLCNVIQPCWTYRNELFEQGLVSRNVN